MDMEEIGRRDAPDICQGVEEKRRANDFKGCGDEFGAEPSAGVQSRSNAMPQMAEIS
jgi:hypothetical protein